MKVFNAGDLVFDVGCNKGNKTDIYLSQGARVICFEPNPTMFEPLVKKYCNNPSVIEVNAALGAAQGTMKMYLCRASDNTVITELCTLTKEFIEKAERFHCFKYSDNDTIDVPVITLDSAINTYGKPDYIKIDVEGFEVSVLAGLSVPIKALSFEYTPELHTSAEKCCARLCEVFPGYKFNYSSRETEELFFKESTDALSVLAYLRRFEKDRVEYGDIFAFSEPK
jgi:FkbM family methyltransferase